MTTAGKVLIIVENLPVPFDRRVWQEARTLTEAGYQVTVICPRGAHASKRHEVLENIEIFRYPLPLEANGAWGFLLEYGAAFFWLSWLTLRVFLSRGFDVIHACNPPDFIFLIALPYKWFWRKKFLFDHHDLSPELYLAKGGTRDVFYRLVCCLERLTFKTADVSIATNESYREVAVQRGGMPPENVWVLRSGPDLTRFRIVPPLPDLRARFAFLVGYVGVMGKQEGLSYLLEAIHHMVFVMGRQDVGFILIGSGPDVPRLQAQVRRLDIGAWVIFTGRIADEDLLRYLCSCDVCVNPDEANALNELSTMNKIMEYMALGKPIVQFDLKEGRYTAQEASLYAQKNDPVDLARKIVELLHDPTLRASMGAYARQRVQDHLAWEHQQGHLVALYRRLCDATVGAHESE